MRGNKLAISTMTVGLALGGLTLGMSGCGGSQTKAEEKSCGGEAKSCGGTAKEGEAEKSCGGEGKSCGGEAKEGEAEKSCGGDGKSCG